MARLMYKEPARHSSIKSSSSITLDQSPCDVPSLLNGELPPPSCTSTSVSSRSSMASTPILPSWSPETPMTPTRQPIHKATAGGGKLVGLGIQIMYDEERSRQFDGLGLVPSRMRNPDTTEEEDLGVPSRILLEEIYQTFTSSDALAAATAAPFHEETDLGDGETSVEDVFMLIKKRSRMSYGLPTAASKRRARQMRMVDTEEGDESRSSDSSGGSALKPAWRY
ncbi:hypothetical protein B0F90DRAFT_699840 [Multifurca ochricompacta]|uniref:Uncharacterized protein n=1 Tax=Multifurca ochricompacta TaxID=376703 RepID=A0AAD4QIQ3_9AGAM|nr:hypothetical protein B0F90DRAFT_699840 [Multifurca ochricompacta]